MSRQKRGVDIYDPVAESIEDARPNHLHETCEDDKMAAFKCIMDREIQVVGIRMGDGI